ncbi:MAG TPA: hypothetical protein VEY91_09940 [Candidatus Limnocylindria bacterium]|nr:hypothetical protein [Candidatus Limnocylindria bacterium]
MAPSCFGRAPKPAALLAGLVFVAVVSLGGGPAFAQGVKPWVPPQADSLVHWAAEARVGFQRNTGDSIGGANFRPYTRVGDMGRKLLRSLGKSGVRQAHAIESVLDSLGLDTEVTLDPASPNFVLLMVRNPYRLTARSVGFLFWYKVDDLRIQGVMFRGGQKPVMRVWWTADRRYPYHWAVIDRSRGKEWQADLKLFKLSSDGFYWDLIQYDDYSPDLGRRGEATFADLNVDGRPEIVSWVPVTSDSLFEECSGCPGLLGERMFVERPAGFDLHDTRLVPSPYASFTLFIRLLMADDRRGATRLLSNPAKYDEAIAAGWAAARAPGSWRLSAVESGLPWPRWLELRHRGPKGNRTYIVRFEQKEGRWIISDWVVPTRDKAASPAPGQGTP